MALEGPGWSSGNRSRRVIGQAAGPGWLATTAKIRFCSATSLAHSIRSRCPAACTASSRAGPCCLRRTPDDRQTASPRCAFRALGRRRRLRGSPDKCQTAPGASWSKVAVFCSCGPPRTVHNHGTALTRPDKVMDADVITIVIIIWCFLCAQIGGAIGEGRGNAGTGAMVGAILGPIGWLIAAVLPYARKCPACLGGVPERATVCKNCGRELPSIVGNADSAMCPACKGPVPDDARKRTHCGEDLGLGPKPGVEDQGDGDSSAATAEPLRRQGEASDNFVWLDDGANGPHTAEQIRTMFRRSLVTAKTPCCRNGDEKWRAVGDHREVFDDEGAPHQP